MFKKNLFVWTPTTLATFKTLKNALISGPVLTLPNCSLPIQIECDAFEKGIRAVLVQQGQSIAYFSKVHYMERIH